MFLKHQPWHSPTVASEVFSEMEFNLWKTKKAPYNDLEAGQTILTVTGGGTARGRVMNEFYINELVKGHYSSLEDAWAMIERNFDPGFLDFAGWTRKAFLDAQYTANAPRNGYLLAFWGSPIFVINQPRPADLRFWWNGWAEMPDKDLEYLYADGYVVEDDDASEDEDA